jgi:hypothetical protein
MMATGPHFDHEARWRVILSRMVLDRGELKFLAVPTFRQTSRDQPLLTGSFRRGRAQYPTSCVAATVRIARIPIFYGTKAKSNWARPRGITCIQIFRDRGAMRSLPRARE